MADKRRLNLAFSMANPKQREVWWLLSAIPAGWRTETVCRMVLEYRDQSELLEAVRTVVREELATVREELRHCEYASPKQEGPDLQETEDVDENVLGFLLSLQDEE